MLPKPRLSLLWLLLLTLLPLVPGDSPASNPYVPAPRVWIPWKNVKLPTATLVRSHQNLPGIAVGQQFTAYWSFTSGTYRPGYWQGDPVPANQPWIWIASPSGHVSTGTAATVLADHKGQRLWVAANAQYSMPPDGFDASGRQITSHRVPSRYAGWVDLGVTETFTDANADGISDDWARHYGIQSANDLLFDQESATPAPQFGAFTAGYILGSTFTAFTSAEHIDYAVSNLPGLKGYARGTWLPSVLENCLTTPLTVPGELSLAPGQMRLYPHPDGSKPTVRFTAPADGIYVYSCVFQAQFPSQGDGMGVGVSKGTTSPQSASIGNGFSPSVAWNSRVSLLKNETLDFTVSPGSTANNDATGLFVSVTGEDTDGDGLTDLLEYQHGTDPNVQTRMATGSATTSKSSPGWIRVTVRMWPRTGTAMAFPMESRPCSAWSPKPSIPPSHGHG